MGRLVELRTTEDCRKILARVITTVYKGGDDLIVQKAQHLINCVHAAAKLMEVEKLEVIEARLEALENGQVYEPEQEAPSTTAESTD